MSQVRDSQDRRGRAGKRPMAPYDPVCSIQLATNRPAVSCMHNNFKMASVLLPFPPNPSLFTFKGRFLVPEIAREEDGGCNLLNVGWENTSVPYAQGSGNL